MLTSRLDQQNEYIDKQVEFKLNETIEKAKEIEVSGSEQPKEIEAPKEDKPVETNHNKKGFFCKVVG